MNVPPEFDAIVVGSGISGGWAAKELCEKGLKVLLLERGRHLEHGSGYTGEHTPPWQLPFGGKPLRELYAEDYPVQSTNFAFDETTRHFFNNDRQNPYVMDPAQPFVWRRADVLGGRSLLWARQVYRWSDLDFEANKRDGHGIDWPIRYADIAPWYSYVEKFAGVSGEKLGLPQLPDGEFQPPMPMNVVERAVGERIAARWPERRLTIGRVAVQTEPANGRGACHYCGPCQRGCSVGAYFSSLSSTLPAARATGNLTVKSDSVVAALEHDDTGRRVSAVQVIDAKTFERRKYSARMVFLCASAVASTQILLNSRSERHPQGLANGSGALGRYLMDHTFANGAFGLVPGFLDKYPFGNRPNVVYLPRFRNLGSGAEGVDFLRGYGYQGMAFRLDWQMMSKQVGGFGAAYKHALRAPGPWAMFMAGFGEHLPHRDNRMLLDAKAVDRFGIPQVRFEVRYRENEQAMSKDIIAQAETMLAQAGAVNIMPMIGEGIPGDGIHEMGTARMGDDPAQSVLNRWNRAHELDNLFLTDGACMASSSCVNPSITYMALTARAADHAVRELREGRI